MDILYPRCAGLEVHKDMVLAAVRLVSAGAVKPEVRPFDPTTPGLLALAAWLAEAGCTPVAMEASGIYRKPVWHILSDGAIEPILANAAPVKNVPGRKTAVAAAVWRSDLLAHGLLRASFVPDPPTQARRALLRTRQQLLREPASHVQRLQTILEAANLKLSSGLASVVGLSGRAIIPAILNGETDPAKLLALVHRGVKTPRDKIRAARHGRVTGQHRFLLPLHLRQIDALAAAVGEIDAAVERGLAPFRQAIRRLRPHPGISDLAARVVAEIGLAMSRPPGIGSPGPDSARATPRGRASVAPTACARAPPG